MKQNFEESFNLFNEMNSFEMLCSSTMLKTETEDINNFMDDFNQGAALTLLEEPESSTVFMDLHRQDEDHIKKIKEFQAYFDMVKKMVKPGCSQEMLKVALNSISSLVSTLSYISSSPKLHSSL